MVAISGCVAAMAVGEPGGKQRKKNVIVAINGGHDMVMAIGGVGQNGDGTRRRHGPHVIT